MNKYKKKKPPRKQQWGAPIYPTLGAGHNTGGKMGDSSWEHPRGAPSWVSGKDAPAVQRQIVGERSPQNFGGAPAGEKRRGEDPPGVHKGEVYTEVLRGAPNWRGPI